jgi:histidine phosphotransferase ChpT
MRDMTDLPTDFGALIAQRLCHDLVNPLGAVNNGLELLAMVQEDTPEVALMRDSLAAALGRIRLYRLGFGSATPGSTVAGGDLAQALEALGGSRKLAVSTDLPAVMPRADARLIVLLALCAEAALAWGGNLTIRADGPIRLIAEARRLRLDPEPWSALAEGRVPTDPAPPLVQFALVPAAAVAAGRRVGVETGPERLTITA